jgi:hypothetical protein
MSTRWKDFSAAEHVARNADAAWEAPKNRGNDLLKDGQFREAAKQYRDAALLALGPLEGGAIHSVSPQGLEPRLSQLRHWEA